MTARQDPTPEANAAEKELQLKAVRDWLGEDWLKANGSHPVRELWNRRDWLATTELLTLGHALNRISPKASERLMSEAANDIRSDDYGNRSGTIFEILAASMFDAPEHPVEMAAPSQKGYDFTVSIAPGKVLRVSCKALIPSKYEFEFQRIAKAACKATASTLVPGKNLSAMMSLAKPDDPARFDAATIIPQVAQATTLAMNGTPAFGYGVGGGWLIQFNPLSSLTEADFWDKSPSYTFIALSPFLGDEQQRFISKIDDAIGNVRKHCPAEANVSTNMIMVRVPSSVSLQAARVFLADRLNDSASDVSAIMLYRARVVTTSDGDTTLVGHEFDWVENPQAKVTVMSLLGRPHHFHLVVPIGQIQTVESRMELHVGSETIDISQGYSYSMGHHYYHSVIADKGASFSMKRVPFISTSWILDGLPGPKGKSLRLDFILPEQDELVLI